MRRIIFSSSWSRVKQAMELDADWHTLLRLNGGQTCATAPFLLYGKMQL